MAERSRTVTAVAWLVVAMWALLIWRLGSDDLSRDETSTWLLPLLHTLLPWAGERALEWIHFGIRKGAHATEYGVFALLVWAATLRTWPAVGLRAFAIALLAVGLLGTADELRQSGSDVRSGSPRDVLLDLSGGAVVLGSARCVARRLRPEWSLP